MRFSLNGVIASDDDAQIYRWFGYSAVSPSDIRKALKENPPNDDFILEINSGGGSVYAGFEMYSVLKSASVPVIAEVQSLAGSAASVVMVAGDFVTASPVGQIMIHLPSTITKGNQMQHMQNTQMLEVITNSIISAYESKCEGKISHSELRKMMDNETFLTADEALKYGFIDKIMGESKTVHKDVMNCSGGLPDISKLRDIFNKAKISKKSQTCKLSDIERKANKRAIAIAEASLKLDLI